MITLSWCIFLPLLTAGILLLIPSSWKGLIKLVALAGAVVTFIIAISLVRGYSAGAGDNAVEALRKEQEEIIHGYGGAAFLAEYFQHDAEGNLVAPEKDENGRMPRPEAYASWAPPAQRAWDRVVELEYAAGVKQSQHLRFVEFAPWIEAFRVNYFVGVDGLSLPLIWLTALLGVLCLVYSWTIDRGTKGYYILFLILETGLIGVFCALDFFVFYVFWEVVLLPMYFLIGIWGGENRIYAAIKFFIYTLFGSVLMLIVMLVMFFATEPHTFNMLALMELVPGIGGAGSSLPFWLFLGLFVGFAIKVPVFPFHTWLPDAHVEAPTAVSVVLAGILLKMGGYGFFRVSYPMLPDAATSQFFIALVAVLGMVNIIYGAFCALAQKDFKKLVAYSSISHMGYVLLGMAALTYAGVNGAVLQMFNHGVSSAMMFLLVGVVYDRAHHRDLTNFGGMATQMPWYFGFAVVGFFASLGLPGLNGFISEVLCFIGAWDDTPTGSLIALDAEAGGIGARWIVYLSFLGIILTAAYILWTIQRVYLGTPKKEEYKRFPDLSFREVFALAPLAFLCILLGVYPRILLDFMNGSLAAITDMVRAAVGS